MFFGIFCTCTFVCHFSVSRLLPLLRFHNGCILFSLLPYFYHLFLLYYIFSFRARYFMPQPNFAYHDSISPEILHPGKKNTQKIERKHLTFRTRLKRLARKTICFSKSLHMHKIMIGLLINVLEFGCALF